MLIIADKNELIFIKLADDICYAQIGICTGIILSNMRLFLKFGHYNEITCKLLYNIYTLRFKNNLDVCLPTAKAGIFIVTTQKIQEKK